MVYLSVVKPRKKSNRKILMGGNTKSCGCRKIVRSKLRKTNPRPYKTPEYTVWNDMIQRCCNPKNKNYPKYGGRGITVCKEWRDSFISFFDDIGSKSDGLTLERIDNNKGYYKENCKWATRKEQARNRGLHVCNKTGVAGVYFNKANQKYCATITAEYKAHFLGCYAEKDKAIAARYVGEAKYWKIK